MSIVNNQLVPTGRFVTVTFVTNDGTIRKLNGRTGVNKYSKNNVVNDDSKYFLIYTRSGSRLFDAPRSVSKSTILSIKASGISAEKNPSSVYSNYL